MTDAGGAWRCSCIVSTIRAMREPRIVAVRVSRCIIQPMHRSASDSVEGAGAHCASAKTRDDFSAEALRTLRSLMRLPLMGQNCSSRRKVIQKWASCNQRAKRSGLSFAPRDGGLNLTSHFQLRDRVVRRRQPAQTTQGQEAAAERGRATRRIFPRSNGGAYQRRPSWPSHDTHILRIPHTKATLQAAEAPVHPRTPHRSIDSPLPPTSAIASSRALHSSMGWRSPRRAIRGGNGALRRLRSTRC